MLKRKPIFIQTYGRKLHIRVNRLKSIYRPALRVIKCYSPLCSKDTPVTSDDHICFCFLVGCTMLFYETYGKASSDPESPCYALLAEDGIVQAVPEHPKKENVFCLSNTYGDVYLFQVS